MPGSDTVTDVPNAMITPGVLISAASMLVLSTLQRLNRVINCVCALVAGAQEFQELMEPAGGGERQLIGNQLRAFGNPLDYRYS
jgi:hypothetical protein